MKAALVIGGVGFALALLAPTMRLLRIRPNSDISDAEYFAAARRRAIAYRLAKTTSNERPATARGE